MDGLNDIEGTYSNIPGDPGGETICGITKRYHPEWFARVMEEKDFEKRKKLLRAFYHCKYWKRFRCNQLGATWTWTAFAHFVMAVNAEAGACDAEAATCAFYDVDSLKTCVNTFSDTFTAIILIKYQRQHYDELVRINPEKLKFYRSWMRRLFYPIEQKAMAMLNAFVENRVLVQDTVALMKKVGV